MNKQPVVYYQFDSRWANKPYRVSGEGSTIKSAGCGPSCASMVIETLTGSTYTPEDACNWSMAHGYKALNQGTYYAYFVPQFKAFGIDCFQLNWTSLYHDSKNPIHQQMLDYLKSGYYVIALMRQGTWTSGGHFVLLWDADDTTVYINDPYSTATARTKGKLSTFLNEAAHYWIIDARQFNNSKEEEDNVVRYKYIEDVPETFRPAISQLMEAGVIGGYDDGSDKPCIDLSHDQIRILIFVYRGGGFDLALEKKELDRLSI